MFWCLFISFQNGQKFDVRKPINLLSTKIIVDWREPDFFSGPESRYGFIATPTLTATKTVNSGDLQVHLRLRLGGPSSRLVFVFLLCLYLDVKFDPSCR